MAGPNRPRCFTDDFKRQIVGLCNGGKTRDDIVLHDCGRGDVIAGVDGRRQGLAGGPGRGERPSMCRLSLACLSRCAMLRASIPAWSQPSGRVRTHQSNAAADRDGQPVHEEHDIR